MVYNAARLKDAGEDIAQAGAMAKLLSSQVCERVTSLAVELFGGYGYTKDYPVEKFYRDAKIGTIYEGTSNMQLRRSRRGWSSSGARQRSITSRTSRIELSRRPVRRVSRDTTRGR